MCLKQAVQAGLARLDALKAASTGPVSVTHIGAATASGLAAFQGTWSKGSDLYLIRDTRLRFPSGARADIDVTSSSTFSISHPSGVTLHAVLENDGRQLSWTNGSVWTRSGVQGSLH